MKLLTSFLVSAVALAPPAFAQLILVDKQAIYVQTAAGAPVLGTTFGYPANVFSMQAPVSGSGAATITPPGLAAVPLSVQSGSATLSAPFASLAALNAAFPNGNYVLNGPGLPSINVPLTGDLYPATIPQITGGTWVNNLLVVNSTSPVTLNFTNFSGYSSTSGGQVGGHMEINVENYFNNSPNLTQNYATVAVGNSTLSATPFTSYSIPAGTLTAGNLYQVTLTYDAITKLDTTTLSGTAIVGLYEDYLIFFLVAQPASNAPAAPAITLQPANVSAPLGSNPSFGATYTPPPGPSPFPTNALWNFNGSNLNPGSKYTFFGNNGTGPNSSVVTGVNINAITAADAGIYVLQVINPSGLVYSQPVTLTIGPASLPSIIVQPQGATLNVGGSTTFTVNFVGAGPFTLQWLFNGVPIKGATASSFLAGPLAASSAGVYSVAVTNSAGTVTSNGATLAINTGPAVTVQPANLTVVSGSTAVFNAQATGSPAPTLQWRFNGVLIAGATSSRLVVSGATAANVGNYTCTATNGLGSVVSAPSVLALAATTNVGRLINLSVNTTAGKSQVLTVGFVTGGAGTVGSENLLIRATGPALTLLGVPNTLADPILSIFNSNSVVVASNDNWGTPASNQTAVTAADTATFAFPLTNPASLDAALAMPLAAGPYTAQISGNTPASGTALAEVYDNTPTASYTLTTPRLINISAKNQIVAGGSMTAGFVVGGQTAKTVLIRATGPALTLLGVPGAIPDPQIALHTTINSQDTVLATNAGWGGDPQITAASNSVFAFPLTNPASADSVVLVTLAPGNYTAVASSVSGAAGTVLIEVYEVP